jgi:hypothetical protein
MEAEQVEECGGTSWHDGESLPLDYEPVTSNYLLYFSFEFFKVGAPARGSFDELRRSSGQILNNYRSTQTS